jgi:recombination protein RecA
MTTADIKKIHRLRDDLADTFGTESVMMASDIPRRPRISSGSLALDFAIGGGMPTDRVIEVAGAEGTGKTSLALLTMQQFLDAQPDRGALILDVEHKLSADWVEQLIGAERMKRVILAWPDTAEQATDLYTKAVKSGRVSFVVFDSIAGAPTQRVTEKSAEVGNIGGNALAITRFAQLASIYSQKYNTLTFCINQVRDDIEGYHRVITPGGRALKHACVLRIQLKKGKGKIDEEVNGEKIQVGYTVVGKVVKNQQAAPGRTAWWWFMSVPTDKYGFGVDRIDEIIRLATLTKVIATAGGWYTHPLLPADKSGAHKVQGLARLTEYIKDHPETHDGLAAEVMSRLDEVAAEVAPISNPDDDIVEPEGSGRLLTGEDVE